MDDSDTPAITLDGAKILYKEAVPINVGRATIAWNTLCGSIFYIYHDLSGLPEDAAKATFFVVFSDRSQRDMTAELSKFVLKPIAPKLNKRVQSLLGDINTLAGKRNDILHVVFDDALNPAKVRQFQERGHLKGASGSELLDRIHKFTMEAMDLAATALAVASEIRRARESRQMEDITAIASRLSNALQWPQGQANQKGYGLLELPATNPPSPEEAPPAEPEA